MGSGITQVAAQAGHAVFLFDLREGSAADAKARLQTTFDGLMTKGRLRADEAQATVASIEVVDSLQSAASAALVVEAIAENLEAKRALFRQLEEVLTIDAVMATNTSSISVTAIANGLRRSERLVGMHFFNPVPLMRLVEVVSGLQTSPALADAIFDLSKAWGKVPVHARSTPDFIVNRIARPYYAETLALLQERAAAPNALDAFLRAVGFRMGPCELMDLIGHDTNFAVTNSVYEANFFDKRFVPSLVQRELVDGGLFGRNSGRGFYSHPQGAPPLPLHAAMAPPTPAKRPVVHGRGAIAEWLATGLERQLKAKRVREMAASWTGLAVDGSCLVLTDGRTTAEWDVSQRPMSRCSTASRRLAVGSQRRSTVGLRGRGRCGSGLARPGAWMAFNTGFPAGPAFRCAWSGGRTDLGHAHQRGRGRGTATRLQRRRCRRRDEARRHLYPRGPFEWLANWSSDEVAAVLDAMDAHYRGERYRVSPWLRMPPSPGLALGAEFLAKCAEILHLARRLVVATAILQPGWRWRRAGATGSHHGQPGD